MRPGHPKGRREFQNKKANEQDSGDPATGRLPGLQARQLKFKQQFGGRKLYCEQASENYQRAQAGPRAAAPEWRSQSKNKIENPNSNFENGIAKIHRIRKTRVSKSERRMLEQNEQHSNHQGGHLQEYPGVVQGGGWGEPGGRPGLPHWDVPDQRHAGLNSAGERVQQTNSKGPGAGAGPQQN